MPRPHSNVSLRFADANQPRILIVRLSAHGDVVQTLPFLGLLRKHLPNAHIGWVIEESAAPLIEGHPDIQKIHISRRKTWLSQLKKNPLALPSVWGEYRQFIRQIEEQHYDVSVDVQGLFKSAVISALAGVKTRLGYRHTREMGSLFYTHCLSHHHLTDMETPTAIKFSEALGALTPYQPLDEINVLRQRLPYPIPHIAEASEQRIKQILSACNKLQQTVALAPATMWPSKRWPVGHWNELMHSLLLLPINIVLVGTPVDAETYQAMASLKPVYDGHTTTRATVINAMGHTRIEDLYALFKQVDVMVGPDSAPMHIANAVACQAKGKPSIVALFGPTGPRRTGPIGEGMHQTVQTQLACQPCFKRRCPILQSNAGYMACQTDLTPQLILDAIHKALGETKPETTWIEGQRHGK